MIITEHCIINRTFNYLYEPLGVTLEVQATVCPCRTELCNADNITFGGTAGTTPSNFVTDPQTENTSTRDRQQVAGRSSAKTQGSLLGVVVATVLALAAVYIRGR